MKPLTERQRGILRVLADGHKHDLFGYPLIEEHLSLVEQGKMIWASAALTERGYIREVESDNEHLWMQITAKGRAALEDREMFVTVAVRDATRPGGLPTEDDTKHHIFFMFDGCVVSGWPLITSEGVTPNNNFVTPEQAEKHPLEVCWESNSDVGDSRLFRSVRYWFVFEEADWAALHCGSFRGGNGNGENGTTRA